MFFVILFVAVTAFAALYKFYEWHAGYWKRRGIPGPEPRLFYGNWKELDKLDVPGVLKISEWTKQYGKVYGMYEGIRKILVISDPEILQELFIKKFEYFHGRKRFPIAPDPRKDSRVHVFMAEGSRWKRLRTLTTPTFSINSLKRMKHTVEDSALHMVELMSKHCDTGKGFNIHKYYQEYTMDVIARVAMGQVGCKQFENPASGWIINTFLRRIDDPFTYLASAMPFLNGPIKTLFMLTASLRGREFPKLFKMIEKTIEERKEKRAELEKRGEPPADPTDFIDLFLDAEADVGIDGEDQIDRKNIGKISRKLSTQEIVAQCFVFLLAGFDTTANSLAYASYLLSKNPETLQRLQEEIDEHCTDEEITYETLNKMTYMDHVVKEALRMYPLGAFANSRTCMESTTLGNIPIEKGTLIMSDPWSVHYDTEIWGEDAHEFKPERWEESRPKHQLAFFPFGAGPRQCIGMRLAYMEEKLALAHLLRRFNITKGVETEKKLKLIGSFTVSPEEVTLYLKSR